MPELAQLGEHVDLRQRGGQVEVAAEQDRGGNGRPREILERGVPEQREHALLILGRGPDVAPRERDGALEIDEALHRQRPVTSAV